MKEKLVSVGFILLSSCSVYPLLCTLFETYFIKLGIHVVRSWAKRRYISELFGFKNGSGCLFIRGRLWHEVWSGQAHGMWRLCNTRYVTDRVALGTQTLGWSSSADCNCHSAVVT
jgi:hypothetical protein